MARARFYDVARDPDGRSIASATVEVFDLGTTTPIAETLYADPTSGTTLTNPFTTATDGEFEFYLDEGAFVSVRYSKAGYTTETRVASVVAPSLIGTYMALVAAPTGVAATDTAVIVAALAAANTAGGGTIILQPGTYVVNAHITVPDKVSIRGAGIDATTISFSVDLTGDAVFGFGGSVSGSDAAVLTVNTSVGVTALTVGSTATLVDEGYYILGSDSAFSSENVLRYKGELVRVASIDSGTAVTLRSFVRDIYTTAASASLRLVTYKTGNGVHDLTLRNTAPGTGTTAGFTFQACKDVRVSNVRTVGLDNQGINLIECLGGTIVGYHAQDHTDDEGANRYGYGINVGRATEDVTITGCHFRNVRHGVTCDGSDNKRGVPRNIVVTGCTATNCTAAAFDTHATGQFITFDGCSATKSDTGFQVRAQDVRILSCSVSHCTAGVNVKADAHGLRIIGSVFRHLRGSSAGTGVTIPNSPDRVTIAHCTFDSLAGHGVLISGNAKRVKVLYCEFSNIGTGGSRTKGVVWSDAVTDCSENVVAFNTFTNENPTSGEADVTGGTMTVAVEFGTGGLVTASYVYNNVIVGVATAIANQGANTAAYNSPLSIVSEYCLLQTPPTAAAIPAGVTEYVATSRRTKVDLSGVVQARTMASIADAWNAGAKVAIQYSLDESAWFYLAGTASASAPAAGEYVPGDALARAVSAWNVLPAAAHAEVSIRMITVDGDAATTGNAGHIALQVRAA